MQQKALELYMRANTTLHLLPPKEANNIRTLRTRERRI
jgi:hypothetical protein